MTRKKPFTVLARWTAGMRWFMQRHDWFTWRRYTTAARRDEGLMALRKTHRDRNYIEFKEGDNAASK